MRFNILSTSIVLAASLSGCLNLLQYGFTVSLDSGAGSPDSGAVSMDSGVPDSASVDTAVSDATDEDVSISDGGVDTTDVLSDSGATTDSGQDASADASIVPWVPGTATFTPSAYYQSFGGIMRLHSGRVLNLFRQATAHSGTIGTVQAQWSSDDGRTWTDPVTVFTNPNYSYEIGGFGVTPTGAVILCFWNFVPSPAQNLGVACSRSADEGATWSTPVPVMFDATKPYDYVDNHIIITPDGIALPFSSGAVPVLLDLVFSHDDGVTWTEKRRVSDGVNPYMPTNEASFLWTGGTTMIGFARNARGVLAAAPQTTMLFVYSRDMGHTWTVRQAPFVPTSFPPTEAFGAWENVSPYMVSPGAGGPITLFYAEREYLVPVYNRGYLHAFTFDPETAIAATGDFGLNQVIWSGGYGDFGYPTAVAIPSGFTMEFFSETTPGGPEQLYKMALTRPD